MLLHMLFALSSVSSDPQQNNAWPIAIFSTGVSGSISILIFILNQICSHWPRIRKSITYEVTNITFLPQASGITNDISIVDIKIHSVSNTIIIKDDYLTPIQFDFQGRKVIYCEVPAKEQFPKHTIDDPTTFFIKDPASLDKLMLDKIHLTENTHFIIRIHVSGSIDKTDIDGWGTIQEGTKSKAVKLPDKRVAISVLFILFTFFLYTTATSLLTFIFSYLQYSITYPIAWSVLTSAIINILLFIIFITIFSGKIGDIRQHGWRLIW